MQERVKRERAKRERGLVVTHIPFSDTYLPAVTRTSLAAGDTHITRSLLTHYKVSFDT
jgi:hypothetical protein